MTTTESIIIILVAIVIALMGYYIVKLTLQKNILRKNFHDIQQRISNLVDERDKLYNKLAKEQENVTELKKFRNRYLALAHEKPFQPWLSYYELCKNEKIKNGRYLTEADILIKANRELLAYVITQTTGKKVDVKKQSLHKPYVIAYMTKLGLVEITYEQCNHEEIIECIKNSCIEGK